MVTYKALSEDRTRMLLERGVENAGFEVSELLGSVLGADCRSAEYIGAMSMEADPDKVKQLDVLIGRRAGGEPLQYILGEWEFYGLPIKVGRGVLIPRQDTETLIDTICAKLHDKKKLTVIDVCSGSGCIACALHKHIDCERIFCVEKSDDAASYLEQNLDLNSVDAEVIKADALLPETVQLLPAADLIVCNPPYLTKADMQSLQTEVSFEPEMALYGGEDGLDFCRDLVRLWSSKIKPGGMFIVEIGQGQEEEVAMMMIQHGLTDIRWKKDLSGIDRCVFGFAKINKTVQTNGQFMVYNDN